MSKKLLFLAYYFPPLAASGSLRAAGFSRHFSRYGFEQRVLTVDPTSTFPRIESDLSLEATLPHDLRIDRLVFTTRLKQLLQLREELQERTGIGKYSQENAPAKTGCQTGVENRFAAAKSRLLDRIFLFPDHQKPWIGATVKHICSLPRSQRPDIILATGNPWSSLVAANRLARRLNIPYVADFRDPWIDNPKPTQSQGVFATAETIERRVVTDAASVVANTDALRDDFMRRYPTLSDKFVTIPNGFERGDGRTADAPRNPVNPSSGIELSYFGSVSRLRNPLELLHALRGASDESGFSPSEFRVRFVGTWEAQGMECESLAVELEKQGYLLRGPAIPHDECLRQMRAADCLLILQQAFPLQIPAKIYEYISAGRPILLVGGEGATKALVENNRLGLACQNDRASLKALLLNLISSKEILPLPNSTIVKSFDYENLTRDMAAVLDRALRGNRTGKDA